MRPSDSDPQQLDLFDPPLPPVCGRGLGPCRIITDESSAIARCVVCGCYAPYRYKPRGQNTPPTEVSRSADALAAIFTAFMESQTKFFQFRHEPESPPDHPAKSGTEGGPAS
jgi:hypothetical protein